MSIKMIFASAAALAMAAGTPAFAARSDSQAEASSAAAEGATQANGERKICRTIDNTESRTKRQRLCYTKDQWKKFEKEMQD